MAIVEPIVEPIVEAIIEPMEPVIMKKKKKKKTEIVKIIPEQIIVNFDTNKVIETPIELPIEINKNIKITEMVECPDCNTKNDYKKFKIFT